MNPEGNFSLCAVPELSYIRSAMDVTMVLLGKPKGCSVWGAPGRAGCSQRGGEFGSRTQ